MFRRHFFLISALGLLAVMAVLGVGRIVLGGGDDGGGAAPAAGPPGAGGGGPGGRRGPPAVNLAEVTPRTFADRIEVLGVARGRQSITLSSPTTELVTRVRFSDGQYVQRGAVLIDLQASEEDANIVTARAAAAQANSQYQRWKTLADKGIASQAALDQYRSAHEQAQAGLLAAQSRRADRVIRAPFSGVVGLTNIAPGALISPGATIATLDDVSVVRVDFDVPDRYLAVVRPGAAILARPDALPGQSFPGRIATVDTRIDERTRAVKARAEFANPGGLLKPGMLIRVGIDQGQRQSVAIPEAAVQFVGDTANVFVLSRRGDQTVAEQRPVTVGVTEGGVVEIRQGLRAGEQVIRDGINQIQSGQAVRVAGEGGERPPGAAAAGGPPRPGGPAGGAPR